MELWIFVPGRRQMNVLVDSKIIHNIINFQGLKILNHLLSCLCFIHFLLMQNPLAMMLRRSKHDGVLMNYMWKCIFNPINTELNPICHLLALVGAQHNLRVSRIRVNICAFAGVNYYVMLRGRVPAANAPGCTAAEGLLHKPWSLVVPTCTARCLHQRP